MFLTIEEDLLSQRGRAMLRVLKQHVRTI